MFLKRCVRKKCGKEHVYWQLVESVRTARGSRHRTVGYLGELCASEQKGWARLAAHLDAKAANSVRQLALWGGEDEGDVEAVPEHVNLGRPTWVKNPAKTEPPCSLDF